ncbi:MAG TPA: DivIVA domain-containing protein [Acidimicrobiia bacterium]|nr:DivIVA domain-containing protein [Acidimicrobiia bacterium]
MDVTPHELRTVELREAWRGYRQDDVDELLDRVAATVERLQAQVERLAERLAKAEEEAGMGREADEMLRRTLLLAQRTADAAVAEAQERARRLVAESEAKAQSIVASAETDARRSAVAERQRLEAEIRDLAVKREALRADVDALDRIADDHRDKLRSLFEAELAAVEARPMPEFEPLPELSELPEVLEPSEEPTQALSLDEIDDLDARDALDRTVDEPGDPTAEAPSDAPEASSDADAVEGTTDEAVADLAVADAVEDAAEGEVVLVDEEADAPGLEASLPAPVQQSVADLLPRRGDLDDDTFFAELKAAVEDDAPLGPRDEAEEAAWLEWATGESVLFDQDAADDESGRIRSVFRRRA